MEALYRAIRHEPARFVVRHVAVWQVGNLLGVAVLMRRRDQNGIGDDVIKEVRAGGPIGPSFPASADAFGALAGTRIGPESPWISAQIRNQSESEGGATLLPG